MNFKYGIDIWKYYALQSNIRLYIDYLLYSYWRVSPVYLTNDPKTFNLENSQDTRATMSKYDQLNYEATK